MNDLFRVFDQLEKNLIGTLTASDFRNSEVTRSGFPPHNVIKDTDDKWIIELAVAGFTEKDVSIVQDGRQLIVEGEILEAVDDKKTYIFKGIATRKFKRVFAIDEHVRVTNASLQDGILRIYLLQEIPEKLKPKTIAIQHLK